MKNLRLLRNVSVGVKSLLLHKLRSFLTMLGIVFGVGGVMGMLAVAEGGGQEVLEQYRKLGSNNIILKSIKPRLDDKPQANISFITKYGLYENDEARIRECFPSVNKTVPVRLIRREGRIGDRAKFVRIVGTTPGWFDLVQRRLISGRVLMERDAAQNAAVCVVSEKVARELLPKQHAVGTRLKLGHKYFQIIGIVQAEGGTNQSLDSEWDVYIPMKVGIDNFGKVNEERVAGQYTGEQVELYQILVRVDVPKNVRQTAAGIETMLKRFHRDPDYEMLVPLALLEREERTQRIINLVLGSIAGISLFVGGIGVMNIMLATVTERTREIGVRRAIGAKRAQIIGQFLVETLVLSTLGGVFGIGVGWLIPKLVEVWADMPTKITTVSVILSFGVSVAVGIIFGLYPAMRAAKLDPIVALRHE